MTCMYNKSWKYEPIELRDLSQSSVADTELVLLIAHFNPTTRFNSWSNNKKRKNLLDTIDEDKYRIIFQSENIKIPFDVK